MKKKKITVYLSKDTIKILERMRNAKIGGSKSGIVEDAINEIWVGNKDNVEKYEEELKYL